MPHLAVAQRNERFDATACACYRAEETSLRPAEFGNPGLERCNARRAIRRSSVPSGSGRSTCGRAARQPRPAARPATRRARESRPRSSSAGTSLTTTEFAPIFTFSPIVMSPSTAAPDPTTTLSPERRVALLALQRRPAEGHALVERHVVADDRRPADHDPRAVIDEEPAPDRCARDGCRSRSRGGRSRSSNRGNERHVPLPQRDGSTRCAVMAWKPGYERRTSSQPSAAGSRSTGARRSARNVVERGTHGIASYEPPPGPVGFRG